MSVNLHLLNIYRPDLTNLVCKLIDRYHSQLAGVIRVDAYENSDGAISGSHLFYLIFREPGSIGVFTVFVCGAGSGSYSSSAQAFQRLMATLHQHHFPVWSLHPHNLAELYQIFGTVRDEYGFLKPNSAMMRGVHPGQYNPHFLAISDELIQPVLTLLRSDWLDRSAHESFLTITMANYRQMWERLYLNHPDALCL